MNLRLLVGIAIFVVGIVAAGIGVMQVDTVDSTPPAVAAEEDPFGQRFGHMVIPAIAGLSLAVGGFLIAMSVGNWKRPRTHLEPGDAVVDPEGYHKMKHV